MTNQREDDNFTEPTKEAIAKAKRVKKTPQEYLPDLEGNERIYEPSRTIGNVFKPHPYSSPNFKAWQRAMREACTTITYGLYQLNWHPRTLYCGLCAQIEEHHRPARYVLKQRKTNRLMLLCKEHVQVIQKRKPNELQTRRIRHRPVYDEELEIWTTKPKKGQQQHY